MIIKTLGKIKWEDIKIGEVFAWIGCWVVLCKISKDEALHLSADSSLFQDNAEGRIDSDFSLHYFDLYKLSKSTQALWLG